jgi:hypothetical protein
MTAWWDRFGAWLRTFYTPTSWRARRDDQIEEQKRRAKREGRLVDVYPDPSAKPARIRLMVVTAAGMERVDLDGYDLTEYLENVVYLERGPIRLANSVIRAANVANVRLTEYEAAKAERARIRAEEKYERAVRREREELAKHG